MINIPTSLPANLAHSHLGYYRVNNKYFTEKIDAILEANSTLSDIEWNFHDEIYSKIDWTTEPEPSLDDFYRMRAQQIRDQYDYVIVMCSGGGDSRNVAYSFLRNGIKIDEIIASAPLEGLKQYSATSVDNSAENTMSETMLAQLPLIEAIHSEYPKVKITLNDYFNTLVEYKTDEWLFRSGDWIHPSSVARYNLEKLTHIRAMADAGKRIAIVYGIDKPTLRFTRQDTIQIAIADRTINVQRPAFEVDYPNVDNVLFYFTPDMPLLQVKQCHVLARWLFRPENAKALSYTLNAKSPPASYEQNRYRNSLYERAIIPCIYPTTSIDVFQGHKPTRMFLGEHDGWFYQMHSTTRTYEMIESDFRNFTAAIHDKYLIENRSGFIPFIQLYNIGKIEDFKRQIGLSMIDVDTAPSNNGPIIADL